MAEESEMGTFRCRLEIFSADGSRSETVDALVDTGSSFTSLPDELLHRLGIAPWRRVESELADGRVTENYIGNALVGLEGMQVLTIVMFAGENAPALLGAYTLEGATLAVDPYLKRLVPSRVLR